MKKIACPHKTLKLQFQVCAADANFVEGKTLQGNLFLFPLENVLVFN